MSEWIRVAAVEEIPPGTVREVLAGDRVVALGNFDGQFYALDGICPHQGGPLGKGRLVDSTLTCPWHGWQFNICTGQHRVNSAIRHTQLAVRVEGNDVLIDVSTDFRQ